LDARKRPVAQTQLSTMTTTAKQTLLHCVLSRFPSTPKRRAKRWILSGRVSVGGEPITQPHTLLEDPGDSLKLISRGTPVVTLLEPWQIHPLVTLLYLDQSLAVIAKGAGILAVPDARQRHSAMEVVRNLIEGNVRPISPPTPRHRSLLLALRGLTPLPVHRLDRYTSGVMCLAMTPRARARLIEQFRAHTACRHYIAFADGQLATKRGEWRHWFGSDQHPPRQPLIPERDAKSRPDAALAVTRFKVLREFQIAPRRIVTKLQLALETGLTHQIRAQAAAAGVPLIGDRLYHPADFESENKDNRLPPRAPTFDRQALHAERLALNHPDAPHARMQWVAPMPQDLRQLEQRLARLHSGCAANR
jgi:23S rRNA pseudouridine1911/1915/1917 synthase